MAFRMTWRNDSVSEDDLVTVYWFHEGVSWYGDSHVARVLGLTGLSGEYVDVSGTVGEIARWTVAATAFVDEVAAVASELDRVEWRTRRWRRRPVVRRWAEGKYAEAKASYLDRVRAAASAYQPVRDVVEGRIAEQEAVRLEAAQRKQQERARRQRDAEARFQAWERRQAVADRPLSGGLTPRQMAAQGDTPTSWPTEVEAGVGDIARWWAGVRVSVRNEQARAEAMREVLEAITATAAALEKARRPGISAANEGPREVLYGWWVDFNWSALPDVERLKTPPDIPVAHLPAGRWDWDLCLYLPSRELFARSRQSGNYFFASVTTERVGNSHYTRSAWRKQSIEEFVESLFRTWLTYCSASGWYQQDNIRTRITDHAEPTVYIPYVQAVAHNATAAFRTLYPV